MQWSVQFIDSQVGVLRDSVVVIDSMFANVDV